MIFTASLSKSFSYTLNGFPKHTVYLTGYEQKIDVLYKAISMDWATRHMER